MTYSVVARNFSQAHDNRIHSDEVAQRYGFTGALVPGVAVFGHLIHPLISVHGEAWLNESVSQVRFDKPAYHGDTLTIEHSVLTAQPLPHSGCWPEVALTELSLACARGERITTLHTRPTSPLPDALACSFWQNPTKPSGRPEIAWDNVIAEQPFAPWEWLIDAPGNRRYADEVADDQPLYEHYCHPHWLLSIANTALTREYRMPAWIHVGSELCLRHALKVGDRVTVHAVPLEKWERKGHQFLRLYLRYHRGSELTTEIMHTAIFRVAV